LEALELDGLGIAVRHADLERRVRGYDQLCGIEASVLQPDLCRLLLARRCVVAQRCTREEERDRDHGGEPRARPAAPGSVADDAENGFQFHCGADSPRRTSLSRGTTAQPRDVSSAPGSPAVHHRPPPMATNSCAVSWYRWASALA